MKLKLISVLVIIILLCSCNTPQKFTSTTQQFTFQQPSSYSFLSGIDLDIISLEYMMRMKKYQAILKESPIPVYVISTKDFATKIFLKMGDYPLEKKIVDTNILGMYFYGQELDGYPNQFIFINKDLTPEQILVTFFHEIGHYYHQKEKCEGCATNVITREAHAFYNELLMGWSYDTPHALESSIRTMAMYAIGGGSSMAYKSAVFEVMRTDLWTQVMKYLSVCQLPSP